MSSDQEFGHPCRLYLISPPAIELDAFEHSLKDALQGGDVGAFQLRLKDAADAEIFAAARRLLPICRAHQVAFIMNDRPDIAAEIGADGVHLGQDDLDTWPIDKARQTIGPEGVIGVSCHDSSHLAMQAGEQDVDYIAFGAFFPTQSKSPEALAKYGTPTLDMLRWWYEYTVLPCVAIGGMTPANCGPAVTAGADFIAAITAVWQHAQGPKQAVADFNRSIKLALKQRKPAEAA
jgi:thiamine-phosphate pyrophosphorylase